MFLSRIPEEDLEELRTYVEVIRRSTDSYDYRLRTELDQVPDTEATEQAEEILNLVEELNQVMIEASSQEVKDILEQVENILSEMNTTENEYLEYISEKAQEIIDKCRSAMKDDPEYITSARRDEILEMLKNNNQQLNQRVFDPIIDEVDSRYSAPLKFLDKEGRKSYQDLCNLFDDCIDKAYARFLKTKTGEYVKKTLLLADKFKKFTGNNPEVMKLSAELAELKKKLPREDQLKLGMMDLSSMTRFEILSSLLSENEFDYLSGLLKTSLKPLKKSRAA